LHRFNGVFSFCAIPAKDIEAMATNKIDFFNMILALISAAKLLGF
jgi:hypothetical protein